MKEGWKYVDFKDIYPIKMGKTPPRGDKSCWDIDKVTNNKWVSIADISQNEGKTIYDTKEYISDEAAKKIYCVEKGALLMSFKLSIGRMAFAGDNLYTNEAIIAIPHNDSYILRFVYYYFLSYDWKSLTDGNEKVKGATLNKQSIGKIKLPIISLSEQQRIVSRLDASFAQIDALSKQTEEALEQGKALFQAELKKLMEKKDGWKEKLLGEVGTFKRGGNFSKKDFVEDGFPCIHYGQIHTRLTTVTTQHLSSVPKEMVKTDRCVKKGDLVIAITSEDDAGSCKCTAWMADYEAYVGGHSAIYSHTLDPVFMAYFFQSPSFQKQKLEYTHGFKVVEINPKDIAKIKIAFPTTEEQQQIVQTLDSLSKKIQQLRQNYNQTLANCQALKQALLSETFE